MLVTMVASGQVMNVAAEGNDEMVDLIMQWPSFGYMPSGFEDVENALNEMLEKDIGVHIMKIL